MCKCSETMSFSSETFVWGQESQTVQAPASRGTSWRLQSRAATRRWVRSARWSAPPESWHQDRGTDLPPPLLGRRCSEMYLWHHKPFRETSVIQYSGLQGNRYQRYRNTLSYLMYSQLKRAIFYQNICGDYQSLDQTADWPLGRWRWSSSWGTERRRGWSNPVHPSQCAVACDPVYTSPHWPVLWKK